MKKFVIFMKGSGQVDRGYFKSTYIVQGEIYWTTEKDPKDARLFSSAKTAGRCLNSKMFHCPSYGVVEEVDIAEA